MLVKLGPDACVSRILNTWELSKSTQKDPDGLEKYAESHFLAGENVET